MRLRRSASQSPSTVRWTSLHPRKEIGMLVNPRGVLVLSPLLALVAFPAISAVDTPTNVSETWGRVPLQFEEHRADEAVRYLARGPGYSLHLTSEEAVLML